MYSVFRRIVDYRNVDIFNLIAHIVMVENGSILQAAVVFSWGNKRFIFHIVKNFELMVFMSANIHFFFRNLMFLIK